MRFPTIWYVRPAKPQISLCICTVWSEPLLVAWIFYDCYATDWTSFGASKLKRRLHSLVWVYTCQTATLLEITSWLIYFLQFLSWVWLVFLKDVLSTHFSYESPLNPYQASLCYSWPLPHFLSPAGSLLPNQLYLGFFDIQPVLPSIWPLHSINAEHHIYIMGLFVCLILYVPSTIFQL